MSLTIRKVDFVRKGDQTAIGKDKKFLFGALEKRQAISYFDSVSSRAMFALRVSIGLSEALAGELERVGRFVSCRNMGDTAMSDFLFNTNFFSDFDRFQRQMSSLLTGLPSSIRASRLSTFPEINLGSTDVSVEIVAFAPGINPAKLELTVDKGLLTISGERAPVEAPSKGRSYAQERFAGAFRRAIELPRDVNPDNVNARYANGCLTISIGKLETCAPALSQSNEHPVTSFEEFNHEQQNSTCATQSILSRWRRRCAGLKRPGHRASCRYL